MDKLNLWHGCQPSIIKRTIAINIKLSWLGWCQSLSGMFKVQSEQDNHANWSKLSWICHIDAEHGDLLIRFAYNFHIEPRKVPSVLFSFCLCCVIVLLGKGQIKLISVPLINTTCSYFKPISSVWLNSVHHPYQTKLESVCLVCTRFFLPVEWFCMSQSLIPAATGAVFHFQSNVFSRSESTAVTATSECILACFCCTVIRQGWLWLRLLFSMWSRHPMAARTCAHSRGKGGTASPSVHMKRTACHPCRKTKRLLRIHYFMAALVWGWVWGQALWFNKAKQLLVCFGGTSWWEGREGQEGLLQIREAWKKGPCNGSSKSVENALNWVCW